MTEATKRSTLRWFHIAFGILPILGYVYSPFDQIPHWPAVLSQVVLFVVWMLVMRARRST